MRQTHQPWQAALAQVAAILFLLYICGSQMGSHLSWVLIGYGLMAFWSLKQNSSVTLILRPALPLMALQAGLMMRTGDLGLVRCGLLLAPLGYWLAAKIVARPQAVAKIKRLPLELTRVLIVGLLITQTIGFSYRLGNSQLEFTVWSWLQVIVLVIAIFVWIKTKQLPLLLFGVIVILSLVNSFKGVILQVNDVIVNASWSGFFGGILAPLQLRFWQQLIVIPHSWDWSILLFPVATFLMGIEVYTSLLADSLGNPDQAADDLAPVLKTLTQNTLLSAILVIESAATRFCFPSSDSKKSLHWAAWFLIILGTVTFTQIVVTLPQQLYAFLALLSYGLLFWLASKPACLTIWHSCQSLWHLARRQPRCWPAKSDWRSPVILALVLVLVYFVLPHIYLFNYQIEISKLWFCLGVGLVIWRPVKKIFS